MVKGGDLSRYNARVSTEMNVLPILRFGINANMSYTDQDNAGHFTVQRTRIIVLICLYIMITVNLICPQVKPTR